MPWLSGGSSHSGHPGVLALRNERTVSLRSSRYNTRHAWRLTRSYCPLCQCRRGASPCLTMPQRRGAWRCIAAAMPHAAEPGQASPSLCSTRPRRALPRLCHATRRCAWLRQRCARPHNAQPRLCHTSPSHASAVPRLGLPCLATALPRRATPQLRAARHCGALCYASDSSNSNRP
jgi:hypothetical protein